MINCFAMSRWTSKCFNNKNNYTLLSFIQERRTLLRLLMTSNNSQNIVKERGWITIVVSRLSYINITSFICIQTLVWINVFIILVNHKFIQSICSIICIILIRWLCSLIISSSSLIEFVIVKRFHFQSFMHYNSSNMQSHIYIL